MASDEDIGTRKLAAIMFTDIRDFSKKMGENELAAMDLLKVHDVMIRDVVAKYGGTIIKSLGDSFMVDFSSAVNAAKCAIEAQEKFWEYNKERSSFEKIEIRIGIHLGDVITVGNDIFGDGVNIAARIEAITEPTRICVSADIYNQIKNKMQIGAYSIGSIELKNIADPVEVFELLIDSIPELAQPSKSAQEVPTRRKAEAITKREEEEAKRVEETRQRVDENRRKDEEDKQERANAHFAKAEEFFHAGDFDKAEEEIREIYKIVQVHYDAQMLLLQIEEERTKREEQQRRQRVKDEKKRKEEQRKQRVQDTIQRAIQHVEQDQFAEALTALREVYTIEPNNPEAKQLEEQIRQAEQAKEELEQLKAKEEEELAHQEQLRLEREAAEALARERAAAAEAQFKLEEEPKKSRRRIYIILGSAAIVAVIAVAMLLLGHFSKPATIAVLNFITPSAQESYLGEGMSAAVAEDLDRVERLSVISPSSTKTVDPQRVGIPEIAQTFDVSYVITGTVTADSQKAYVTAKLIEAATQNVVWESSIQGNLVELNNVAADISSRVAKALEIEAPPAESHRLTSDPQALRFYLEGRQLIYQPSLATIDRGIALLREAVQLDSLFAVARTTLADGELLRFEREGERDRSRLTAAEQSVRAALTMDPRDPLAYEVLGEIYRHTQQYRSAWESITRCLSLRPGNAECYRQLALLSLIAGDRENAQEYAETALSIDPRHFESSFVMGLIRLYEEDFEGAAQWFDTATSLGAPDSLLTVNYKFKVWSGLDQEDKVIAYCQSLLDRANDETKLWLYYSIGRAYQLSGSLESLNTLDDGLELAESMVSSNPTDVTALAYLALLNARRARNPGLAARVIANVDSLAPGSASALYWKARVYAIQKDKAHALTALAKAVAIDYRFSEVLDPDFLSIQRDPEFISTISLKLENQAR